MYETQKQSHVTSVNAEMNGPQRTARLAKGCSYNRINGHYQRQWHHCPHVIFYCIHNDRAFIASSKCSASHRKQNTAETKRRDSSRNSKSSMNNMNAHRQYAGIMYAPQNRGGGMLNKKNCQGPELDQNDRSYTKSQLSGHIPVTVRWRTRHTLTHGQCAILSLAGSQNLCQAINAKSNNLRT